MTQISHDQLFKELLTTFFVEFLELFFPQVLDYLDTDSIAFEDKELFTDITKGRKKLLDIVALAKFRGQDYTFLVHVENQSYQQDNFPERMYSYHCNLFLKYRRPIYPIAVFSYKYPLETETTSYTIDFPDRQVLNFQYQIVQLNRLNWRDFLRQQNPVAAALMAKMKISKGDRPIVKAECLRLLVTLQLNPAKMQLISGFVDTYLRLNQSETEIFQEQLNTMELEQQEQIMQLTTSWKEEGRLEERKSLVFRLLNRKLGELPEEDVSAIQSLEPSQLELLAEDLLDFQSLEDLESWLNEQ
ncbi:MAG TPA: Rpn family recombination-promoting nuclease/putative transposase [Xenococcaceae cyanobacterium]